MFVYITLEFHTTAMFIFMICESVYYFECHLGNVKDDVKFQMK